MRILFLLFFISFKLNAQVLSGAYLFEDKKSKIQEGYYFFDDSVFTWFEVVGEVEKMGRGKFCQTDDTLLLKFEKARRQFGVTKLVTLATGAEEGVIKVLATDSLGRPVSLMEITIGGSEIKAYTDLKGECKIVIPKPKKKEVVRFEREGYDWLETETTFGGYINYFEVGEYKDLQYRENDVNKCSKIDLTKSLIITCRDSGRVFRKVSKKKWMRMKYHFERYP